MLDVLMEAFAGIGTAACVLAVIVGVVLFFKRVIPAQRNRKEEEARAFHETLLSVRELSLAEAIVTLRRCGLFYETGRHIFELPKVFWAPGDAELKAGALLTLMRDYEKNCGYEETMAGYFMCQTDLARVLAKQVGRTPGLVIAMAIVLGGSKDRVKILVRVLSRR